MTAPALLGAASATRRRAADCAGERPARRALLEGGATLGMLAREGQQDWPPRWPKALVTAGGTYADYVSLRAHD
jgi:hypothetical protein